MNVNLSRKRFSLVKIIIDSIYNDAFIYITKNPSIRGFQDCVMLPEKISWLGVLKKK